jgi:hypothetical protein
MRLHIKMADIQLTLYVVNLEVFSYLWRKQKTEKCHKNVLSV